MNDAKYAWIDAQRREYPLPDMCEVLAVSVSGYRAWRRGGKPDRTRLTDPQAVALMKSIHAEVKAAYGSRRMHHELQGRGQRIGLRRVERLMREHGRRRQAIEPAIGHTKLDHRMDRCWLAGAAGDALHALLCAAGYNIRWLLRAIVRGGLKAVFLRLFGLWATLVQALHARRTAMPTALSSPAH